MKNGSDGQLGHGSLDSYKYLRHINSFRKKDGNLIVITQVSAGADESSSHSAAIDSDGNLYLWGKAVLCGNIGYEIVSTGVKKGGIRSKRGDPVILPCQVQYLKVTNSWYLIEYIIESNQKYLYLIIVYYSIF